MSEFGDNFKRARQSHGISLDQIASETRISIRFLQAIENEDFHLLPGGIFNRGFIRTFAERVGIDAEQAVVDYERLVHRREPAEDLTSTAPSSNQADKELKGLFPIAIGILALVILIFYAVTRGTQNSVIENQRPSVTEPAPQPTLEPPPIAPEPAPAETSPSEPAPPIDTLALEIEIHEPTWIKLVSDGNEVLSGEVLQPGTTWRYTAQDSIDITIGNAGGLVLKVNDREVQSLGRSGQVREFNITPQNLSDIFG